jgi:hypothetical protein
LVRAQAFYFAILSEKRSAFNLVSDYANGTASFHGYGLLYFSRAHALPTENQVESQVSPTAGVSASPFSSRLTPRIFAEHHWVYREAPIESLLAGTQVEGK